VIVKFLFALMVVALAWRLYASYGRMRKR